MQSGGVPATEQELMDCHLHNDHGELSALLVWLPLLTLYWWRFKTRARAWWVTRKKVSK